MTVAVIFGGKSCEHNISIITGLQVLEALSSAHEKVPVYIDETGVWWTGKAYGEIETYRKKQNGKGLPDGKKVHLRPSSPYLYGENGKKVARPDVFILANHGVNGEDGSLQGLLQLSGIPFTGSGVRASAVGMDKIMMKQIFAACFLPVLPYVYFDAEEYNDDLYGIVRRIKEQLRFPLMVKPSNLGSSIGISKARDWQELFASVRVALEWDSRVLVENALENFTELNCACIAEKSVLTVSEVEKPIGWKEFLTFEDKYMSKSLNTGREFPAKILPDQRDAVLDLTKRAYKAVDASGIARVDFLLDGEMLYVNEINTIPGAFANYLFAFDGGISFSDLLDKNIRGALEKSERAKRLKYSYKPPLSLKIKK